MVILDHTINLADQRVSSLRVLTQITVVRTLPSHLVSVSNIISIGRYLVDVCNHVAPWQLSTMSIVAYPIDSLP